MRTIKQCLSSRLTSSRRPAARTGGLALRGWTPRYPPRGVRSALLFPLLVAIFSPVGCVVTRACPANHASAPKGAFTSARAWILTPPRKASPVGHAWFSRTASKAQKGGAAYAPPRRKRNSGARYLIATSLPFIPSVNSQRVIVSPESNMATSLSPSPQFTESLPWPSATSIVSLPAAPCTSSRPP